MIAYLYSLTFDKNRIVKSVPSVSPTTVSIKSPCDLHDPILQLEHSASNISVNYAYIPDFGRHYFVDPPEIDDKVDILYLHVDVLMSFSVDIKNSIVIATRSNFHNKQFDDNMVKPESDKFIDYRKLADALTGETYVAIIGG